MAANTAPIFPRTPDVQLGGAVLGPSANTALDGTGANVYPVFQADPVEGSFLKKISLKAVGSPAATVCRVFVCSVTGAFTAGTSNTAANSHLYDEIALPAITLSQTAQTGKFQVPLDIALPAGWRVFLTFGTSTGAAGTGYVIVSEGGKY
jgi:hypothetical protein